MYIGVNCADGTTDRIYRMPSEIKEDIEDISDKIQKTYQMFNIRSMLLDIIEDESAPVSKGMVRSLEETLSAANEALEQLKSLDDELTQLKDELREVRWVLNR